MRITLQQTGSKDDMGKLQCCICSQFFYLGPVTCWALAEVSNIHWGDVCPVCIQRGAEYIQRRLDHEAWSARMEADQAEKAAAEGIADCPTVDEFLAAEAFYERPMFESGEEYVEALERGEV